MEKNEFDWPNFKATHKITVINKEGITNSAYVNIFEAALLVSAMDKCQIITITPLSKQLKIFKDEEE